MILLENKSQMIPTKSRFSDADNSRMDSPKILTSPSSLSKIPQSPTRASFFHYRKAPPVIKLPPWPHQDQLPSAPEFGVSFPKRFCHPSGLHQPVSDSLSKVEPDFDSPRYPRNTIAGSSLANFRMLIALDKLQINKRATATPTRSGHVSLKGNRPPLPAVTPNSVAKPTPTP